MPQLDEHPWRRSHGDAEQQQAEALWAIAAELRELNKQMEDQ